MIRIPAFWFRRSGLLTALGILFFVVFLFGVLPVWAAFHAQEVEADAILADIGRKKSRIEAYPDLMARKEVLRQRARAMNGIGAQADANLARDQMRTDLKRMFDAQKVLVRNASPLPASTEMGLDALSMQYDLMVPATRLQEVLFSIENHTPYIFISRVVITSPENWPEADASGPEPKLALRATLKSYRWTSD